METISEEDLYEANFNQLNRQIELLFETGPGATPLEKRDSKIIAAIVPNSNYSISGKCAAWAYKELAETPMPLTYVVIGSPEITKSGRFSISLKDFSTPFGLVKNEKNTTFRLLSNDVVINEEVHKKETSIQIQLPFLQYINRNEQQIMRFTPVLTSTLDLEVIQPVAKKLAQSNEAIYIASSNLLHYGPLYNFTPFKYNINDEIMNLNTKLIDQMLSLDTESFIKTVESSASSLYGAPAIALLMEILKIKGIKSVKTLSQFYSVTEDNKNTINHISVVYEA